MKYIVTLRDRTYEVEVEEGEALILDEYEALAPSKPPVMPASHDSASGGPSTVAPPSPHPTDGTVVAAPLPGNVLSINVTAGEEVKEGDVLLLIEAMKMENEVVAPCGGIVQKIAVSPGQMVSTGDVLAVI